MSHFRTLSTSDPRFAPQGLQYAAVKSKYLGGRGDISIYVPKEAAEASSPLPWLTLLHGVYGSHWSWTFKGGAHLTLQRLVSEGKIRPMVLAMPSDGLWGDGSGYVPHQQQNFEAWIVEEVALAVEELVEGVTEASPRFLAGLSMGGWGTLRLGATYPQVWRGISAHSAITRWDEMKFFVEEDISRFAPAETEVFSLIRQNRQHLPPLRFDCGVDDLLIEGNRLLHRQLTDAKIPHQYEEFPGSHEWPYWEQHLVETLLFCEAQL